MFYLQGRLLVFVKPDSFVSNRSITNIQSIYINVYFDHLRIVRKMFAHKDIIVHSVEIFLWSDDPLLYFVFNW